MYLWASGQIPQGTTHHWTSIWNSGAHTNKQTNEFMILTIRQVQNARKIQISTIEFFAKDLIFHEKHSWGEKQLLSLGPLEGRYRLVPTVKDSSHEQLGLTNGI